MARIVSAVSPDCETKTQTSSRKMGVLRSRKSEASSTETGISVSSSKIDRVCGRYKRSVNLVVKAQVETYRQARVVRGTARDKDHASTPPDDVEVSLETSERDGMSVKVDTSTHRVDDGFGLLVNLLLHKVVELTLHDGSELNFERLNRTNGRNRSVVAAETVNVKFCDRALVQYPHYTKRDLSRSPPSAMWAMSSSSR